MLLDMLSYMRPEGSRHQRKFCRRFIEPVFGDPDDHGNYTKIVGDKPNIAFMAHHDTVHNHSGRQKPGYDPNFHHVLCPSNKNSNCLGADCTTGVYIILEMIKAEVPGVYVIHAAEEAGGIGSENLVKDAPGWLTFVDAAISFDRKGTDSVITHQWGGRCCSDKFAVSLADILGLPMEPDTTGSFTDSANYVDVIGECTNLSVGYFHQHTSKEYQDLSFLKILLERLIEADWSQLEFVRQPGEVDYFSSYPRWDYDPLSEWVVQNSEEVAMYMRSMNISREDILFGQYGMVMG